MKSEGLVWVPVSWFLLSDTVTQKLWHALVSLFCTSVRVQVLLSRWPLCVDPAYLTRLLVEFFVVSDSLCGSAHALFHTVPWPWQDSALAGPQSHRRVQLGLLGSVIIIGPLSSCHLR